MRAAGLSRRFGIAAPSPPPRKRLQLDGGNSQDATFAVPTGSCFRQVHVNVTALCCGAKRKAWNGLSALAAAKH